MNFNFLNELQQLFHRDVSKFIATSKMKLFVELVCGPQPSTNVTKNSILGVAGV